MGVDVFIKNHEEVIMFNPNNIIAGVTYDVLFNERAKAVHVSERTGNSPESYCWKGTLVKTGRKVVIRNAARFVGVIRSEEFGPPLYISFDIVESSFKDDKLQVLLLSIREKESNRLITDLPDIPAEILPSCAEVIRYAIRFCRSSASGFDVERLHFFDDENKVLLNVTVDLSFDLWDPVFAGEDYCSELFRKIETAWKNHRKTAGIQDDFLPNSEGEGAIYWTEKTGVVKVLWLDSIFLKTLYLQSEEDIRNFAEGLFGEHGHSFETLRKLLDTHEGEWLDPPENFAFFPSYKAIQFDSILLGVFPTVYESDEEEGMKYFGRIVFSENKIDCPDVLTWKTIENKVWLRTNNAENWDYFGPFENHTAAAREAYEQFFA